LNYTEEDRGFIGYGLRNFVRTIGGILLAVLGAGIMGILPYALVFLCVFVIIRIYTGGYHATTPKGCSVSTSIMIFLAYIFIRNGELRSSRCFALYWICLIIILSIGPVENRNKSLSYMEVHVYSKRLFVFLCIVTIIFAISYLKCACNVCKSIVASMVEITALQVVGAIDNIYRTIRRK